MNLKIYFFFHHLIIDRSSSSASATSYHKSRNRECSRLRVCLSIPRSSKPMRERLIIFKGRKPLGIECVSHVLLLPLSHVCLQPELSVTRSVSLSYVLGDDNNYLLSFVRYRISFALNEETEEENFISQGSLSSRSRVQRLWESERIMAIGKNWLEPTCFVFGLTTGTDIGKRERVHS